MSRSPRPHLVSRLLIRQWARPDSHGAPRVRVLTVGTGEISDGVHPRRLMLGRGYVPQQFLVPLERTWAQAEQAAGSLLRASQTPNRHVERILEDDKVNLDQGGQAIRRLMLVHLIRSLEWTSACDQAVEANATAMANEPGTIRARSRLSTVAGGLLLPATHTRQRVYREARDYLRHGVAQLLPSWYAQSLGTLDSHCLYVIRAPHGREFVLGDTPAFTVRVVKGEAKIGLGSMAAPLGRESEVVMPLGPAMCALLTRDPSAVPMNAAFVDWVNDVQSDRAMGAVVCSPEAPDDITDRVVQRIVGRWGHGANGVPLPPPADEDVPAVTLVNM